jgi:hypothetical protein
MHLLPQYGRGQLSVLGQLRQFDRVLVTSGLRPIPDKRIGTSQDVAMANWSDHAPAINRGVLCSVGDLV